MNLREAKIKTFTSLDFSEASKPKPEPIKAPREPLKKVQLPPTNEERTLAALTKKNSAIALLVNRFKLVSATTGEALRVIEVNQVI
jgi:hypothetical protein